MKARLGKRGRGDGGATLPELLMAIVLSTIVTGVAAGALIVSFGRDEEAATRLDDSHNAQLLSIYLPADVESTRLDGAGTLSSDAPVCAPGAGGTNVLALGRPREAGYQVSYRVEDGNLVRHACLMNGSHEQLIVVRNLDPDTPIEVRANEPPLVSMRIREISGFAYTVTASRRTPAPPPPDGPPPGDPPPSDADVCRTTDLTVAPGRVTVDPSGSLTDYLAVTMTTTGLCKLKFELLYEPSPGDRQTATFSDGDRDLVWAAMIPAKAHSWSVSTKSLTVWDGGEQVSGGTASLLVDPYTPPACTVTAATVAPNTVRRRRQGGLDASLRFTVTLDAACIATPPRIRLPVTDGAPLVLPMTASNGSWVRTIDKNEFPIWTEGSKSITVLDSNNRPLAVYDDFFTVTPPQ